MDEAELSRAFPIGDGACLEAVIGRYGQAAAVLPSYPV